MKGQNNPVKRNRNSGQRREDSDFNRGIQLEFGRGGRQFSQISYDAMDLTYVFNAL
ncbi:hypothetical protein GHT06_011688 [Daphnia sinensis]|uniref:Uncharacterized protein n=1 Tax=Daphnia sinensis TaxID=1820382 RepID=A0AAD5KUB4_9CRUS|nr:hypothetical protein GHT06_011688 [Daphnia sinensis]